MKIKELLNNIDSSVLTEESKTQICDVFELVVNEKVESQLQERIGLEIQAALSSQDDSHSEQLTKLLEAIDKDHCAKLQKMVSKIDEDHTKKLESVVEHYEKIISEDAKTLTESLHVDISNFLDLALEEVLPNNILAESVANAKAAHKLKKIQELVSVDETFINRHVKEALEDGKSQIDQLKTQLNTVLKENVKLSSEKSKIGSELVLEKKTHSLPDEKKAFLSETFKGKSPKYIAENFDYALKMFERRENNLMKSEKAQVLVESVATTVDTPKEESLAESTVDPRMSEYVSGLV